jgi:hypothetical protein
MNETLLLNHEQMVHQFAVAQEDLSPVKREAQQGSQEEFLSYCRALCLPAL